MDNKKKNEVVSVKFGKSKFIPKPEESINKGKGWKVWGKRNDYPYFLIDLFEGSAWHQGILTGKVHYISGGGISAVDGSDITKFVQNGFSDYSVEEVIDDATEDFEMFNGCCVKGTWNIDGDRVAFWEHVDFDKVRPDATKNLFHISDDWTNSRQTLETTNYHTIKGLNFGDKTGSFLIYFMEKPKSNRGEKGYFPKPNYIGGVTDIQTDCEISTFHLNEISQGFSGGTIINLANGIPESEEQKKKIVKDIKGDTAGTKNAGEVKIVFSDGADNAASVLQLSGNDLDKRYSMTEKSTQQNILVCHKAVNPLLFGIKTEGQLGGATELVESYEIFKNIYVNVRQRKLNPLINRMANLSGYEQEIQLNDAPPIQIDRKEDSSGENNFSKEKKLDETIVEMFSKVGRSKEDVTAISSFKLDEDLSSENIDRFEGDARKVFDLIGEIQTALSDFDKSVLKLLSDGNEANVIARSLEVPLEDVVRTMEKLKLLKIYDAGLTPLAEDVINEVPIDEKNFELVYSYELRPGVSGGEVIPGTRGFCRSLLSLNRFYTREEIEEIGDAVGRDVWRYRGGWWNDNGTNKPFCRHIWKQSLIRS